MRNKRITHFDVSADGNTIYALSDSDADRALYKSTDAGCSWEQYPIFTSGYTLTVSPENSDRVLFGQVDGLYLSTDGLETRSRVLSSGARMSDLAVARSNPSTLYAITEGYVLFKSTDGGEAFTQMKDLRNEVLNADL